METNLYFVRHAHSIYTPEELERPLSETGVRDAVRVTEFLKKEVIDQVVSSPYKRAMQTVEGIASFIGKDIEIVEDLRERTLSGKPVEDFDGAITRVWQDPNFSWEGGESNSVAQKRGVGATLLLLENYRGKNIVVGTHGNLMVLIMSNFDPSYDFQFWQNLEMPDIYQMTFAGNDLVKVRRIWEKK
ncbi:2,3-bisphosphoglycerate-dependent phosphoglycerate mutase [Bacillus oleivorans]|uniref:2,3-bisphosphoglycerate-dependent phosphoglycerate mutase n=1 Tax=Bacillus oleivorans TaxID=1448271 RepID=A0A285CI99_9BACI|nr:histidine phosphatase family protein [Bacillus oleivorans]SNX67240.1 2,3-bisphosphoglycerate-dependent phosphoglycerate mutase [Bacillus oleivorans]